MWSILLVQIEFTLWTKALEPRPIGFPMVSSKLGSMLYSSVGWLSLFCENCWFRFFGVGSDNHLHSSSFFKISHFENRLDFQNLEKNSIRWFSRSTGLTEFWTANFQRQFSRSVLINQGFLFYTYILGFFCVSFVIIIINDELN
jgi:hypothetical protein